MYFKVIFHFIYLHKKIQVVRSEQNTTYNCSKPDIPGTALEKTDLWFHLVAQLMLLHGHMDWVLQYDEAWPQPWKNSNFHRFHACTNSYFQNRISFHTCPNKSPLGRFLAPTYLLALKLPAGLKKTALPDIQQDSLMFWCHGCFLVSHGWLKKPKEEKKPWPPLLNWHYKLLITSSEMLDTDRTPVPT